MIKICFQIISLIKTPFLRIETVVFAKSNKIPEFFTRNAMGNVVKIKNIVLMVDGDGKESSLYLYQMFCIKT